MKEKESLRQRNFEDLKNLVSSKFFLNGENGEPDFVKYFEIQSSISKSMIGFYLNSGDFTEVGEFYELGLKLFYF